MSPVSSVVARLLPLAVLVPAQVLVQVPEDLLALAQVLVHLSFLLVVATEVFLCFHHSPVVALSELVIHVLSRLQMAVVSVHLLPTLAAPQSRWLMPSEVQLVHQQSQCSEKLIPKAQTSPLPLP